MILEAHGLLWVHNQNNYRLFYKELSVRKKLANYIKYVIWCINNSFEFVQQSLIPYLTESFGYGNKNGSCMTVFFEWVAYICSVKRKSCWVVEWCILKPNWNFGIVSEQSRCVNSLEWMTFSNTFDKDVIILIGLYNCPGLC